MTLVKLISKFSRRAFLVLCLATPLWGDTDVTAPSTPVVLDEGAYSGDDTVQFSWSAIDAQSGIARYQISTGTTPEPPPGAIFFNVGSLTEIELSDLAHNTTQYVYIKAVNGAGLTSAVGASNGILIDLTLPSTPVVLDSGVYSTSASSLSFSWTASDAQSGIARYEYSLGTSPGSTDVVSRTTTAQSSVSLTGLSLRSGTTYYLNVQAINGAGLSSTIASSDGILVDTIAPSVPDISASGAFTSSNTQLRAAWTASTDTQSGLSHYLVSIGTTAGATNVVSSLNVGTVTSRTFTGLSLNDGQDYFFKIQAVDLAGNRSASDLSSAIRVDTVRPTTPVVSDAGAYTSSTTSLRATWTTSSDPQSGILRYEISVGTSAGATDILSWTSAGTQTEATLSGLTLSLGQTYFINVRSVNNALLKSNVASSDGITVDTTPPTTPIVLRPGPFEDSLTSLSFTWSAQEDVSVVTTYNYTLGTAPGLSDAFSGGVTTEPEATLTGLSLTNGRQYFLNVRAFNSVGLQSGLGSSEGVTVDVTAPTPPTSLNDGGNFVTSNSQLRLTWTAATDAQSRIESYLVGLGTAAGLTNLKAYTSVTGLETTLMGLTMTNGSTVFATIKSVNGAGLQSTVLNADGVKVDTTAPSVPTVRDEGLFTDVATELIVSWNAATDAQSSINRYEISVGTEALDTSVFGWTPVGTVLSYTVEDLTLTQGETYFVNVKAVNQAGLTSIGASNGITVDLTPPSRPQVTDQGTIVSSNTALSFSIRATEDVSAIPAYLYSLGTAAGRSNAVPTATTTQQALSLSDLHLTDGVRYYLSVKALNTLMNASQVGFSDGILVDGSAPTAPVVTDDGVYTTSNTTLSVRWTLGTDAHSGITGHEIALGTTAGGEQIRAYQSVGSATAATFNALSLVQGQTYYVSVRATNGAGLRSVGTSDGITVDITDPTTPTVTDEGVYTMSTRNLSFSWTSSDTGSGVSHYVVALGNGIGKSNIVSWQIVSANQIELENLSLTENTTYYLHVAASDRAGNLSKIGVSDGIRVDTTPPDLPTWVKVTPEHESLDLLWRNPSNSDLFGVMLRSSLIEAPETRSDGELVFHVTGNAVTSNTVHRDLEGGTRVFYSLFVRDIAGNWSEPAVSTSAIPLTFDQSGVIDEDTVVTHNLDLNALSLKMGFYNDIEVTLNRAVTVNGAIIGVRPGSAGVLTLPLITSKLLLGGNLIIGQEGSANVKQHSGQIKVTGNIVMAEKSGSSGRLEIEGGQLLVSGNIRKGAGRAVTINITDGTLQAGSIAVPIFQTGGMLIADIRDGIVTLNTLVMSGTTPTLRLILPTNGTFGARAQAVPTSAFSVTTRFEPSGTLEIVIPDLTAPVAGTYQLFATPNMVGTFNAIVLPTLTPAFKWVTENLYITGEIEIQSTDLEPKIIGLLLNYPNPVRFRSDQMTRLGYELNQDLDVEIHLYTMMGRRLYKTTIEAGDEGGKQGYNRVPITESDIGQSLPAGIYFYVVVHNGKILGKGKMAVQP